MKIDTIIMNEGLSDTLKLLDKSKKMITDTMIVPKEFLGTSKNGISATMVRHQNGSLKFEDVTDKLFKPE
jgi:hypothetical protein